MLDALFCSSAAGKAAPNSRSDAIDDACTPGQLRLDASAVSMGVLSMHHARPGIGRLEAIASGASSWPAAAPDLPCPSGRLTSTPTGSRFAELARADAVRLRFAVRASRQIQRDMPNFTVVWRAPRTVLA